MMRFLIGIIIIMASSCSKHSKVITELDNEVKNVSLQVTGTIPSYLSGTLIRNGPINFTIDGQKNDHWFDGLAMLHAFSFSEGKVSYTNQFLHSDAYEKVFKEGSLDYGAFAQDPCQSRFKHILSWFLPAKLEMPNANVNVAKIADAYVALTETPLPVRFDLKTLDTLGVLNFQDKLPHAKIWESAHPHFDQEKRETINYLIDYGQTSFYTIYRIKEGSSTREVIAKVPVDLPAYMHSFAITENYIVLAQFPFVVKPLDLITKGKAFIKNFTWRPDLGTQFLVIDRHSGSVVGQFKTRPFMAFHHANAYEKDDSLIFDIVTYENADVITSLAEYYRKSGPKNAEEHFLSKLERFTLPLKTGKITSEILLSDMVEFPRINEKYDGHPYRFLYLTDPRKPVSNEDTRALYKINTDTRAILKWSQPGCYPGEPVFVKDPQGHLEDDGVILSLILDKSHHTSFLLILNAKTFQEVARAQVIHLIPPGLHGQYF